MKKLNAQLLFCFLFFVAVSFTACKGKTKENAEAPVTTIDSPAAPMAEPVVISGDDELRRGVMDATKDYSTVKADVTDGVINLTGEIKREDWQKLNPTLTTLHPKRINSENLTIK